MAWNYLKQALVRTRLEQPARRLKRFARNLKRWRRPEMAEIYLEGERVDALLQAHLRQHSNCIDVGAHLGSMLSDILRLSPQGHHQAFEAMPEKARWLRKNFPEVTIHETALSDRDGTATFYENRRSSGFSGLRRHYNARADTFVERQVDTRRLDGLVPTGLRIDFMKLDVEGAELLVLRGADRILEESRPLILFECTRSGLKAFGLDARDVYRHFTERDYGIFLLKSVLHDGDPLTADEFLAAQAYPFKAFNFVARSNNRRGGD